MTDRYFLFVGNQVEINENMKIILIQFLIANKKLFKSIMR